MNITPLTIAVFAVLGVAVAPLSHAAVQSSGTKPVSTDTDQKINTMEQQLKAMQQQLAHLRQEQAQAKTERAQGVTTQKVQASKATDLAKATKAKTKDGIHVGGAMRFQYSYADYDKDNKHRVGDTDFDIFRLNFSGKVDNIELNAEWRWFQYMSAIKFAWLGYDFSDTSQVQVGITRIPFGNQPYDSHNYFFSSNYYLGLEDTYQAGVEYVFSGDPWNVQLAFFKNDALGGIDGDVSSRSDSYSYNVVGVRGPGEGTYDDPQDPIATVNTVAARVAYTFKPADDLKVELGASGLHGGLESPVKSVGNYQAYALHMNADYKRWNVQAQASHYEYNVDGGATRMAVGAYAFYDTIPARADSYTFNVKYHQPVQWGPIHSLDFYNDYSMVTHKTAMLPSTFMNVLGMGVSAGDLYTYLDFVTGRNQPFIGGTMVGNGKVKHRFNINFGFYF